MRLADGHVAAAESPCDELARRIQEGPSQRGDNTASHRGQQGPGDRGGGGEEEEAHKIIVSRYHQSKHQLTTTTTTTTTTTAQRARRAPRRSHLAVRDHRPQHGGHQARHKAHHHPAWRLLAAGVKLPSASLLLLLASLFISALATSVSAFNVDPQSAVVHAGPQGSYFGYTVAQHKDRNSYFLLVGAPKAQTSQPRTERAGAVYKCAPTSAQACQQLVVDPNGSSVVKLKNETAQADEKSHQWFGGSLGSASDGSIIACAPKYVYYTANMRRRDPVGTCWISRGSFSAFLEYSPCRINDQWGHHHLGSCQAGFASAITKDGGKVFMGAPGAHVWQGQAFEHNLKSDLQHSTSAVNPHHEDDSYLGYSLALGRFSAHSALASAPASDVDVAIGMPRGNDLAGKIVIVDREMHRLQNITGEQLGAYFGYSLATADVNGDGLDDLIIGAPLFYNQTISHKEPHFERGRVYVALQNSRHEFTLVQRLDGHKNRARFGTAVANCGDLNRDGLQDVAVGAPYDGPEHHGAVYIYMGRRGGGGGGGSSGPGGLSENYDQVIYAEQVGRQLEGNQLRSFGFSLSGGLDIDGNQYPDLLVGDYEASRAVLLRSRPVVNVTSSLTFTPENFNLDDKAHSCPLGNTSVPCITVQYCTKYTGLNVDSRLGFVYDVKLDTENKGAPRLFFLNGGGNSEGKSEERTSQQLTKDSNQCRSFKAYVPRQVRDKLTPLRVDIDYSLADYAGETFDYNTNQAKLRPVLNRLPAGGGAPGTARMSKAASIMRNCGPDNVCVPDLKLTVVPNLDSYTIGTQEPLVLDVSVRNLGEDAFESMFYLDMPMAVDFKTVNKTGPSSSYPVCYKPKPDQTGVNVLTCDLGNPQPRNEELKFRVIMEPARAGGAPLASAFTSPDFTFMAQVNSTNPEQDDKHREDNQVAIGIPVRVEVQLVLSGNSVPPLIVHNSTQVLGNGVSVATTTTTTTTTTLSSQPAQKTLRVSETDVGQEVQHKYQLHNKGPSTISDIALVIVWPSKSADGDHLLYLVDEPFTSDNVKCQPSPEGAINPLGLKYLQGDSVSSAAVAAADSRFGGSQNATAQRRYRRQAPVDQDELPLVLPPPGESPEALAQRAPATSVDNAVLEQLDVFGCGPTRCTLFECNVYELRNNQIATIRIRSRLDRETISKLSMQNYDISSRMVAQVKALPYNVTTPREPYLYKVVTTVSTVGMSLQDRLPWWLVVVAILLGILLFALLACFLKYLGFFNRKRKPSTAGATTAGAEREPLTPTMWNDYQYTPGDTAL